ncbi:hypothetical protein PtB15_9B631 [Puccinia triticina]|nr:hypothetical protein PtB15_9B631 [Puccinia triticina]
MAREDRLLEPLCTDVRGSAGRARQATGEGRRPTVKMGQTSQQRCASQETDPVYLDMLCNSIEPFQSSSTSQTGLRGLGKRRSGAHTIEETARLAVSSANRITWFAILQNAAQVAYLKSSIKKQGNQGRRQHLRLSQSTDPADLRFAVDPRQQRFWNEPSKICRQR